MQAVKMVVTGPFSAGKTEFIGTISEIDVVSTERKITSSAEQIKEATTVAMDFGRITVDDDLVLYLFGTPGQRRFDFMWDILSQGMLGFVVMVDSTKPETFREAKRILETFESYASTPYVVAANKQDLSDAWEPEDIRIILRIAKPAALCGCRQRECQGSSARVTLLDFGGNRPRKNLRITTDTLTCHLQLVYTLFTVKQTGQCYHQLYAYCTYMLIHG
jgi:uncharacterized protein